MDHIKEAKRRTHPKETTNIFSFITFFYTLPLFRKGWKKDLEVDDLYEVISTFRSKKLGDKLEREWEKQRRNENGLSITRLLWVCFGWEYLFIGFTQLVLKTAVILLQPRAMGKLILYFAPHQTELTKRDAWYYAALVIGLNLFNCLYDHNYHLVLTGLGIQIRTAFCSLIYRKALKLSPQRLSDISIGKIVTLITKDVHTFEIFVMFANDIWIGVIKTAVVCYMIYARIGTAAFAGVGFFFVVLPIQIYLGSLIKKLRIKVCRRTDERLQTTQETLSAVKIVKMYTWEQYFVDKISDIRKSEIGAMHKIFYLHSIVLLIGTLNSKIAFYLLVMTYIWLGNNITAEIVYYILSCFQILMYTMSVLFPIGISQVAVVAASIKRIGNVLKALEIQEPQKPEDNNITIKPKVTFKNATYNFKEKEILIDINLNFDMGVTLVTGTVGAGKSFLLKTILKDYEPKHGVLVIHGRISYASQEPWLFPSSIKQNIIFGEKFDNVRYQQVLDVCALRYDLELLAAGENTIVEDRGINLSRGQQARINLARAVYKESEIYLLDDCLAALDTHVSEFIFKECIIKYLRNKVVILVTHNTNHLKDVDYLVVLDNRRVKTVAKPSEINNMEIIKDFNEGIKKKTNEKDDSEDDDGNVVTESSKLITETTTERKVYQETKQSGAVKFEVYKKYARFGGGFFMAFSIFVCFGLCQFVTSYADKLVSQWVNIEQELSNFSAYNSTHTDGYNSTVSKRDSKLQLYSWMIGASSALHLLRFMALYWFARNASINLHRYMITNIINATMHFFDTNFIGNILNRFSKDLTTIDEYLPFVFYHVFTISLLLIGIVSLISSVNITFLIPTVIVFIVLVIIRRYYLPTGRSLKRLDAVTRSPVIGHLNATLEGLTTIRAFKAQDTLRDEFDRHQDLYTSANYVFQCSMRAFAFFLDTLCTGFIAVIIIRFFISDNDTLAGNVGLAISQAFMMTGTLQWGIRQWAEIENQMTSVERVLEYTEVEKETKQGREIEYWPTKGAVEYKNVYLTYPNSPNHVLKNINFTVLPRQKIGIVGRTGAGKSSIISTLFRLYDVEGQITIDRVDIKTISLEYLRKHISIIPQDPVLFTGTIRTNIDPRGEYTDEEIWKAIETSNLKSLVGSLDFEISENGSNFSVGQRQLICMARAVIRKSKIIVLDEATASMDPETDELIQKTIENNFSTCTVFTIAHKLHSILHSDKVMVMDKGEVIEFNDPLSLLENQNGIFFKMVKKAKLLTQIK